MKKIKLNETDLIKIVNKVLNEQEDKEFSEDEIEFLHFIFERELKPPFTCVHVINLDGDYLYLNRDSKWIGYLRPRHKEFVLLNPINNDIEYKVCSAFGFSRDTLGWWYAIKPHLKSWMENQLNVKLNNIYRY